MAYGQVPLPNWLLTSGDYLAQMTLPLASWKQWIVKVGVVLGVVGILALGLPGALGLLPDRVLQPRRPAVTRGGRRLDEERLTAQVVRAERRSVRPLARGRR